VIGEVGHYTEGLDGVLRPVSSFPLVFSIENRPPNIGHSIQQTSIFPGTTSFFPIDISQSMSIANAASFLEELGSLTQTASGGLRDPVDALGANDPRMNIIRKGVIDNRVADVLFDL
jgi:hypothetical protein